MEVETRGQILVQGPLNLPLRLIWRGERSPNLNPAFTAMVYKWSFALLLVVAIASSALAQAPASNGTARIYVTSTDGSIAVTPPNVTCSLGGTDYHPTVGNTPNELVFTFTTAGTYECTIEAPGFYRYVRPLVITGSNSTLWESFYVVPVRPGISILPEPPKRQNNLNTQMNMTFPAGVFPFAYAAHGQSASPSLTEGYYYGTGIPSTSFYFSYNLYHLSAAANGTYRLGFSANWGNFSMSTQTFYVFAGMDQQNGFIKHVTSDVVPSVAGAHFWYAGDIIVSNPDVGCSTYNWTDVNEYSVSVGFTEVSHGAGETILEECYDTSPAALQCSSMLYDSNVQVSTCGAFGDPHVRMFNGTGVTCGQDSIITLVDNQYVAITAQTTPSPGATNGATDITSITLQYKSVCNPIITTFTFNSTTGYITPFLNTPLAGNHRARVIGNNIFIDAIRLRLQVRAVTVLTGGNTATNVVFGLSLPSTLADASTGICSEGCPAGTAISLSARKKSMSTRAIAAAAAACDEAGIPSSSFAYEACLFDVATTGSDGYASVASEYTTAETEVSTNWDSDPVTPVGEPSTPPTGTPTTPSAPATPSSPATPSAPAIPPTTTPTGTPDANPIAPSGNPVATAPTPTNTASVARISGLLIAFGIIALLF